MKFVSLEQWRAQSASLRFKTPYPILIRVAFERATGLHPVTFAIVAYIFVEHSKK